VTRSHGGPRNSVVEDELLARASLVRNVDAGGRGGAGDDEGEDARGLVLLDVDEDEDEDGRRGADEDKDGANLPRFSRWKRQKNMMRDSHHALVVLSCLVHASSTSSTVHTSGGDSRNRLTEQTNNSTHNRKSRNHEPTNQTANQPQSTKQRANHPTTKPLTKQTNQPANQPPCPLAC